MPSTEASLSSGKYYLVADFFVTLITARPYYPDICIDVDLSAEVAATPIRSITFLVGNLSSHGARLHLLDKVPPATPLLQCCRSHAAVCRSWSAAAPSCSTLCSSRATAFFWTSPRNLSAKRSVSSLKRRCSCHTTHPNTANTTPRLSTATTE